MKIPDKVYDILKWLIVIVMPAAATAIIAYGQLFSWSDAVLVAESIIILQTFLGAIFAFTSVKYYAEKANGITIIKPVDNQKED